MCGLEQARRIEKELDRKYLAEEIEHTRRLAERIAAAARKEV
jgi:hypothetical protein